MGTALNIAFVLYQYRTHGGYERQGRLLAEGMAARGHIVTIYSRFWPDSDKVNYCKVPNTWGPSWLRLFSFALLSALMLRKRREEFDLIVGLDRSLKMDLYRAGNACHQAWLSFRKAHEGIRGRLSIFLNPLHLVINSIEKRLFNRIKQEKGRVVVLSEAGMKQILRFYDVPEKLFSVIPPAIDFSRFDSQANPAFRNKAREAFGYYDELVLLHVGSGYRIKGLRYTIRAVALLKESGVHVMLRVVGKKGRGSQEFVRLAEELGVEDIVLFEGVQEDMGQYYASSDILVLPSLFETFSAAVMEALSFELPVVVGEGAGVSSYISDLELGRVVASPSTGEEVADAIRQIIAKGDGSSELRVEKRKRVASQCRLENVMSRYERIFMEMADAKR